MQSTAEHSGRPEHRHGLLLGPRYKWLRRFARQVDANQDPAVIASRWAWTRVLCVTASRVLHRPLEGLRRGWVIGALEVVKREPG
jgi:hypothetical protein